MLNANVHGVSALLTPEPDAFTRGRVLDVIARLPKNAVLPASTMADTAARGLVTSVTTKVMAQIRFVSLVSKGIFCVRAAASRYRWLLPDACVVQELLVQDNANETATR